MLKQANIYQFRKYIENISKRFAYVNTLLLNKFIKQKKKDKDLTAFPPKQMDTRFLPLNWCFPNFVYQHLWMNLVKTFFNKYPLSANGYIAV